MHSDPTFFCRVCGYPQLVPQYAIHGNTPSFEICLCCGVEFGYEDTTRAGVIHYRKNWIDRGLTWFNAKVRPKNWSWEEQQLLIPLPFR